jgi:folylpolyglutamate synthase/dihydropteroate synthase
LHLPHLVRFNERIQVTHAQITDADIVRLYRRVHQASRRSGTYLLRVHHRHAFDESARRRVDWAVIETGMEAA